MIRQCLWQAPRLLVCLVKGHRWMQPIALNLGVSAGGNPVVVRGCGRCGRNTVTAAVRPNRATRRRIAKAAR